MIELHFNFASGGLNMPPKSIEGTRLQGFKVLNIQGAASADMTVRALARAVSPSTAAALTPAAAKLTKADLVALNRDPKVMATKLNLDVKDLNSIKKAFARTRAGVDAKANGGVSVSVTACCCPCCCAAAVMAEAAVQ
jgi:hypothetical protein